MRRRKKERKNREESCKKERRKEGKNEHTHSSYLRITSALSPSFPITKGFPHLYVSALIVGFGLFKEN